MSNAAKKSAPASITKAEVVSNKDPQKTASLVNGILNLTYHDFRLCIELPIKAKLKGLKYSTMPSFERNRIAGKKKVNAIIDGFLILYGILVFVFKK